MDFLMWLLFGNGDFAVAFIGSLIGGVAGLAGKALGAVGLDGVLGGVGKAVGGAVSSAKDYAKEASLQAAQFAADRYSQKTAHQFQKSERLDAEDYSAQQAALNREFQSDEAARQMDFQSGTLADQREFQRETTGKQMGFQERMASTQVQRAADDMDAAGLNRTLALGQPAAAPAGSAGAGSSAQGASGSGSSASSSGGSGKLMDYAKGQINMATALQTIKNMEAQRKLTEAQTGQTKEKTKRDKTIGTVAEGLTPGAELFSDILGGATDTASSTFQKLKAIDSMMQDLLRKGDKKINTIKIRRGNHPNDRKKNWSD